MSENRWALVVLVEEAGQGTLKAEIAPTDGTEAAQVARIKLLAAAPELAGALESCLGALVAPAPRDREAVRAATGLSLAALKKAGLR